MVSFRSVMSRRMAALALAAALGGCATQVATTADYAGGQRLQRPRQVVIPDFEVDWTRVRLDQGVGARMQRQATGADPALGRYATAQGVEQAIADALARNVERMGLPVQRGAPGQKPAPGSLIVQGQIVHIDEGNRTRRMAIGFGAGKSDVRAEVQVYYLGADGQPKLLQTYDADSNSGRKPGMASAGGVAASSGSLAPLGVGAALGLHSETTRTGVAGEGERLADRVAHNLGELFAREGWIAPSAVPPMALR